MDVLRRVKSILTVCIIVSPATDTVGTTYIAGTVVTTSLAPPFSLPLSSSWYSVRYERVPPTQPAGKVRRRTPTQSGGTMTKIAISYFEKNNILAIRNLSALIGTCACYIIFQQ